MSPKNMCCICGHIYEKYEGKSWLCPACYCFNDIEYSDEERVLLNEAEQKLRIADFYDAELAFEDIIEKYPNNAAGYWGHLRACYGVKEEKDYNGRKIPTCYSVSIESVLDTNDYKKAIELADKNEKEYYQKQAEYLECVRKVWVEKASKEEPYDIFISYKDSDVDKGIDRTKDSYEAQNLYIRLIQQGYRVFFSRESLRDKIGEKYEPYIFNAISTAKVMIVYGLSSEYIKSTWVKNEWSRYLKRIARGERKENTLIVACDGFNIKELPTRLSSKQCLNASRDNRDFYLDLFNYVKKIIKGDKGEKSKDIQEPNIILKKSNGIEESKIVVEKTKEIEEPRVVVENTILIEEPEIIEPKRIKKERILDRHKHDFRKLKIYAPTCTQGGYTEYGCECGEIKKTDFTPKRNKHEFSDWEIIEASCEEDGKKIRECLICGYIDEEIIKAKGHSFLDWQVDISDKSKEERICKVCGFIETKINENYKPMQENIENQENEDDLIEELEDDLIEKLEYDLIEELIEEEIIEEFTQETEDNVLTEKIIENEKQNRKKLLEELFESDLGKETNFNNIDIKQIKFQTPEEIARKKMLEEYFESEIG